MRDQAVRVTVGHSIRKAARYARVNRKIIERFERDPMSVGLEVRARCIDYYRRLRVALETMRALHIAEVAPTETDTRAINRLVAELRTIVERELAA